MRNLCTLDDLQGVRELNRGKSDGIDRVIRATREKIDAAFESERKIAARLKHAN